MDPTAAIPFLAQYGSTAALVFVVVGFVYGIVLTRGHHTEIVDLWKQRLEDAENRCKELSRENAELRQALVITNSQASRATGVLARVVGSAE